MNIIHLLGWTLVHSIWDFALIALLVLVVRLVARSAQVRYVVGVLAIAGCLVGPCATMAILVHRTKPAVVRESWVVSTRVSSHDLTPTPHPAKTAPVWDGTEAPERYTPIEGALPLVVKIWAAGFLLMSLRFLGGLVAALQMKKRSRPCTDGAILALVSDLANRFHVRRRVLVRILPSLESPSTIGFLRTIVFLPASMLSGFPADQLEALLAHELAHVRRLDYLVNLFQSVIEALFFYHPAIWWISSTVRVDREHCCDDLAIEILGDRALYAKSLLVLEEMRLSSARFAMAASGSSLVNRIRRIAGPERSSAAPTVGLALATLALASIGFARKGKPPIDPVGKTFVGQVLKPDGKPAAGALVQCTSTNEETHARRTRMEKTDSQGKYAFVGDPKEYDMLSAYLPNVGFGALGVYKSRTSFGTLRLKPVHRVQVQFVDAQKNPLRGMEVGPRALTYSQTKTGVSQMVELTGLYKELRTKTNDQGFASFDLPAGLTGFRTEDKRYLLNDVGDTVIPTKTTPRPMVVTAVPAAELDGSVELNGMPVPNVMLAYSAPAIDESYVATDGEGRFHLKALADRRFNLVPDLPKNLSRDWCVNRYEGSLRPGSTTQVRFELSRGALLRGRVLNPDGSPARYVMANFIGVPSVSSTDDDSRSLLAFGSNHITNVANDGSFELRVPPGTYTALVSRGVRSNEEQILVEEGKSYDLKLTAPEPLLTDKIPLTCRVLTADGQPAALADVELLYGPSPDNRWIRTFQTNDDGEVSTDLLPQDFNTSIFRASWKDQFGRVSHHDQDNVFTLRLAPPKRGEKAEKVAHSNLTPEDDAWWMKRAPAP